MLQKNQNFNVIYSLWHEIACVSTATFTEPGGGAGVLLFSLLLIFQNSEEAVLFHSWHISLQYFLILNLVFVVEMQTPTQTLIGNEKMQCVICSMIR